MVVDMGYWYKVIRRLSVLLLSILGVYLAFKLSIFYMPFLIAFIISLLIEPIIKIIMKKLKFSRKVSSIIVFVVVFAIIAGLLGWGIATLISEATNLLQGFNQYFDKISSDLQRIMENIDFTKFQLSPEVINTLQVSAWEFLGTVSTWLKNGLMNLLNGITSIPSIAIYFVVTLIAVYFICTDRIYILDQLEHHLPSKWVKKMSVHLRDLVKTLGCYLKAQAILILISFVISLIGLYIFHFIGLNVQFPLLVALGIGFVDALPILGSGTIMIPWAIISAFTGDMRLSVAILILWAIMSIVREFIEPKIVSGQIGIHPIFTLIAMYTGFKFIGVFGMLLGPIILIILKNVFSTFIDKGIVKSIVGR